MTAIARRPLDDDEPEGPTPIPLPEGHVYAFRQGQQWTVVAASTKDLEDMATAELDNRVPPLDPCEHCGGYQICGPDSLDAEPDGHGGWCYLTMFFVSDDARFVVCECGWAHPIETLEQTG